MRAFGTARLPLAGLLLALGCGGSITKAANLAPVAVDDQAVTNEDEAVDIALLSNDSDPDGDGLTIASISTPAHGAAEIRADGKVRYTPQAGFSGADTFGYTVSDGRSSFASASVSVRVIARNRPPVAADDAVTTEEETPVTIAVLSNDGDPDGEALTIESVSSPAHGTAQAQAEGTILYTPTAAFVGEDRFEYTLRDGRGARATAQVRVTVTPAPAPTVILPKSSLTPEEIAVVVNDSDPQSVAVADYYRQRRGIPAANLVHVQFTPGNNLTRANFAPVKAAVDAALGPTIQALALSWTLPYKVDCMSVTSAFALGFDTRYCSTPCGSTASVPYYNSESVRPYRDFGIRPAMSLAGTSLDNVKALIDRGVSSDDTFPAGTGYFVVTTDPLRSVRQWDFQSTAQAWSYDGGLSIQYLDNSSGSGSNFISGMTDVLFYFTGLASVPQIATNTYRPGAVADHLTSYGGVLPGGGQMSILRWLEAGATASYGTVVEPCNYTAKFPSPRVMLPFYFRGQTVLEAYWKSVAWPGEGIFVGEPLARPWGRATVTYQSRTLAIELTWLRPGKAYELRAADAQAGPFTAVQTGISVPHHQMTTIVLPNARRKFYELVESDGN